MRYRKECECGLTATELQKHRHSAEHKYRLKIKRWYDMICEEMNHSPMYIFPKTNYVLNEMKQYLGLKD